MDLCWGASACFVPHGAVVCRSTRQRAPESQSLSDFQRVNTILIHVLGDINLVICFLQNHIKALLNFVSRLILINMCKFAEVSDGLE